MAELKLWILKATGFTPNLCGEIVGVFTSLGAAKDTAETLFTKKHPADEFEWRDWINDRLYPIVPDDWEQISEFEIIPVTADEVILK